MSEATARTGVRSGASVASLFSDNHLVRRAIDGDQRAFTAIFNRYHQSLYRFCLAIVGEPQDAQDALQNTMVKVLRALPGEKRRIELKPWLYRIAHNESIEVLRRRRGTVQLDSELMTQGSGLAEEAEVRDRLRRLISDLDELPDRQRSALVMRELAGLDFAEIGKALGTSSAVARQTVYEARLGLNQMEAGREMSCAAVTKTLSDADGRVTRRRDIRAHLRSCSSCRRFREELDHRQRDLAALAPLPAVAATGLLHGLLGSHGGSAGGGLAGGLGAASGKALGTSALVKSTATVAVVAAVGFSAAKGDLVHVGLPGKGDSPPAVSGASQRTAPPVPSAAAVPPAAHQGRVGAGSAETAASGKQVGASHPAVARTGGGATPAGQTGPPSVDPAPVPPPRGAASHPHGRGHEKQLPAAAAHGQQTAAAHKGGAKGGPHTAEDPPAPPAKPPHPPHPSTPAAEPASGSSRASQGSNHESPPQAAPNAQPVDPQVNPPLPQHTTGKP